MTKRPTPSPAQSVGVPVSPHPMRRSGARREVTERVSLHVDGGKVLEGWALNVSRGGLRAILEENINLGQKVEIALGEDGAGAPRAARVVWVQEEPDGVIVGLEYAGMSGTHATASPAEPPEE